MSLSKFRRMEHKQLFSDQGPRPAAVPPVYTEPPLLLAFVSVMLYCRIWSSILDDLTKCIQNLKGGRNPTVTHQQTEVLHNPTEVEATVYKSI